MFTSFIAKKMLESQLKNIPEDQREKIISAFEKNPELFKKIAIDIQEEMKKGANQMTAAMNVAGRYKNDLQALMGDSDKN